MIRDERLHRIRLELTGITDRLIVVLGRLSDQLDPEVTRPGEGRMPVDLDAPVPYLPTFVNCAVLGDAPADYRPTSQPQP